MLQPKDTDWLKGYKNKTWMCALYKRLTSDLGHIQTESEGMEKDILCKWKSEENWSSNTHRQNRLLWEKEGQYLMIKGSVQEEDVTVVNIYTPNAWATQNIRQMLTAIKWEIDMYTCYI